MKEKILWGIAVVGLVLGVWAVSSIPRTAKLPDGLYGVVGTLLVENYDPYNRYNDGYYSENAISLTGADGDLTVGGGSVVVTTTNSATSTVTLGCIQSYATSTATTVRFVLSSAGTSTATYGAGSANGGVSWQYGTCPV